MYVYKNYFKGNRILVRSVENPLIKRSEFTIEKIIAHNEIEEDDLVVCYISDLHLDNKLKANKKKVTENTKINYIKKIIKSLANSLPEAFTTNIEIVFCGDISHDFNLFKMFFREYRKLIYERTFVVLGNHEYWNLDEKKSDSLGQLIDKYKKFLNDLQNPIILLDNHLFFPNKKKLYEAKDILQMNKNKAHKLFSKNGYAIFGGVGFAGLNKTFNYDMGLYRNAPLNREIEINLSKRVENIHEKLREIAGNKKIYFITHNPLNDWLEGVPNANWIYINGHTHKNMYIEDDNCKIYADNQIGYKANILGFKRIHGTVKYNCFADFIDGIHEISRDQYIEFYNGMGSRISFNKAFEKLYLLKKNNLYCFLIKSLKKDEYMMLSGGNCRRLKDNSLQYYYENLDIYASSITNFLAEYQKYLKEISKAVKSFGGNGRMHGCIVDIDFYNHLYVNPFDATVTPYFAYDMKQKYVYNNLLGMLKEKNNKLYQNLQKLLNVENNDINKIIKQDSCLLPKQIENKLVEDTEIYKISKIVKNFQYATQFNIIRSWNDKLLQGSKIDNGKRIIYELIYD